MSTPIATIWSRWRASSVFRSFLLTASAMLTTPLMPWSTAWCSFLMYSLCCARYAGDITRDFTAAPTVSTRATCADSPSTRAAATVADGMKGSSVSPRRNAVVDWLTGKSLIASGSLLADAAFFVPPVAGVSGVASVGARVGGRGGRLLAADDFAGFPLDQTANLRVYRR